MNVIAKYMTKKNENVKIRQYCTLNQDIVKMNWIEQNESVYNNYSVFHLISNIYLIN